MKPILPVKFKSCFWILALAVALTACQGGKIHQTYEGPAKSVNEISTLNVPQEFNVMFIDKKKFGATLYSGDTKISFLPGPHHIIIYYKDFLEAPGDESERVESKPISINFNAVAGQQYRINFKKPNNLEEARAYSKNPSIEFVDMTTNTNIAANIEYNLYTRSFFSEIFSGENNAAAESAPVATAEITAPSVPIPVMAAPRDTTNAGSNTDANGRALEMLKYWWETASEDQKKAFQEWVGK